MSSPGPRPAETRVSDDISLCKVAQGLPAWLWLGDRPLTLRTVTSNLGSASVDKGTFSAVQTVRSHATRFVRDQQQSRSQTMLFHSVRRASGLTIQLDHRVYRLFWPLTSLSRVRTRAAAFDCLHGTLRSIESLQKWPNPIAAKAGREWSR